MCLGCIVIITDGRTVMILSIDFEILMDQTIRSVNRLLELQEGQGTGSNKVHGSDQPIFTTIVPRW